MMDEYLLGMGMTIPDCYYANVFYFTILLLSTFLENRI